MPSPMSEPSTRPTEGGSNDRATALTADPPNQRYVTSSVNTVTATECRDLDSPTCPICVGSPVNWATCDAAIKPRISIRINAKATPLGFSPCELQSDES
jgi:hypothetical protein